MLSRSFTRGMVGEDVLLSVLGLMLVISPLQPGPVVYFAATVWALMGGTILIGDAVRLRRLGTQAQQTQQRAPETTGES